MPDSNGKYLGSYAGVLPTDNSAYLQHLHDQFVIQERQRQLDQQKAAEDAQKQQADLVKYIGDTLDDANFGTGGENDPNINKRVQEMREKYFDMINKQKVSKPELALSMQRDVNGLAKLSARSKATHEKLKNDIAYITKNMPGINPVYVAEIAGKKAYKKQDEKGNWVDKDWSEIDPTENYAFDVIRDHPELVYAGDQGVQAALKDPKLRRTEVVSMYDDKSGNNLRRGGKLSYAYYARPKVDPKSGSLLGSEVISEPVKINGKAVTEKIKDPVTGEFKEVPIMGLPEEFYRVLTAEPNGFTAAIETELIRKYPEVDRKSPAAETLRRKIALQKAEQYKDEELNLDDVEKEAFNRRKALGAESRANRQLKISEGNAFETKRYHDFMMNKNKPGGQDGDDVADLVAQYVDKSGQVFANPLNPSETYIAIPTRDVDPGDNDIFSGKSSGKDAVAPIEVGDQTYWLVDQNGDIRGENMQLLDRNAIKERLANKQKSGTSKSLNVGIRQKIAGAYEKLKKTIAPTPKKQKPKSLDDL